MKSSLQTWTEGPSLVQMETDLSLGVAINMTGKESLDARKWFLISV